MKKIFSLILVSLLVSGCSYLGYLGIGSPDARWADYKNWSTIHSQPITGDHTGFLGGLHEGEDGVRQVFVNDIGLEASLGEAPYKYPIGTVIAKEQYPDMAAYNAGRSPGFTAMVKVSDDAANPAENWAWSRGFLLNASTTDSFCSGCHTISVGNDYVFSNATSLADFQ